MLKPAIRNRHSLYFFYIEKPTLLLADRIADRSEGYTTLLLLKEVIQMISYTFSIMNDRTVLSYYKGTMDLFYVLFHNEFFITIKPEEEHDLYSLYSLLVCELTNIGINSDTVGTIELKSLDQDDYEIILKVYEPGVY